MLNRVTLPSRQRFQFHLSSARYSGPCRLFQYELIGNR
jgi:hypothetical protein